MIKVECCFDSLCRFKDKEYIFEYKETKFKIITGDDDYCDLIITLTDNKNDVEIYKLINLFLSSIGWVNKTGYQILGMSSRPIESKFNLEDQGPSLRIKRYYKNKTNLNSIIVTKTEDQEKALSLFNEAKYSNNIFYTFLCFWRIIEIKYPRRKVSSWIDDLIENNSYKVSDETSLLAKANNKSIGNYFYENFRCAIAHCSQEPLKMSYRLNDVIEIRIIIHDLETLVKNFINKELQLTNFTNKIDNLKVLK